MSRWYLAIGGEQHGPMSRAEARERARTHPDAHAWREGFTHWRPVKQVDELQGLAEPTPGMVLSPPSLLAEEIDFEILGAEMQYVEIELDPGESAIAEAGAMLAKDPRIVMQTIFGDGSGQDSGVIGKLLGAGKRVLSGEGAFTTVFTHQGEGKARVSFAAPHPGHVLPVALPDVGGRLICQKDALLCAAKGVAIGVHFQRRILTGLFGGEGFIMQRLIGDGLVFLHAGGTVIKRELEPGEVLHVDTGCLVALTGSVNFDVEYVGGVRSALLGGEGMFFASLTGPGTLWLQSLPVSRLAGRLRQAAVQDR